MKFWLLLLTFKIIQVFNLTESNWLRQSYTKIFLFIILTALSLYLINFWIKVQCLILGELLLINLIVGKLIFLINFNQILKSIYYRH